MKHRETALIALLSIATLLQAQQQMDADASEPQKTLYMKGFPPPPDKRINARDGSFFKFPALRYSVVHMREFMPTINVPRGNTYPPTQFEYSIDNNIDTITFLPTGKEEGITWRRSLDLNYTDGILILHRGKIVYEKYFGELSAQRVHALMSVTKSFTGTLASMLVAEGHLDPEKRISQYVPELKASGFGDATVRQVMDMTTAIKYSEDYNNPAAEIWQFSAAGNPMAEHAAGTPQGYYEYLPTIIKDGEHGNVFGYKTANAEVLGWIISTVTGENVAELLTNRIWSKLGMEQDAYYQIDALGIPFAGGGLDAGLRDLARFGQMMLCHGEWQGMQIVPRKAVEDIVNGGNQNAFAKSEYGEKLKGWSYRNMWWITENSHGAYMARGVHGQALYIDPAAEMVIVRLASSPHASNLETDPISLPAFAAVADYLLNR